MSFSFENKVVIVSIPQHHPDKLDEKLP